jgi:hypothetical protein
VLDARRLKEVDATSARPGLIALDDVLDTHVPADVSRQPRPVVHQVWFVRDECDVGDAVVIALRLDGGRSRDAGAEHYVVETAGGHGLIVARPAPEDSPAHPLTDTGLWTCRRCARSIGRQRADGGRE